MILRSVAPSVVRVAEGINTDCPVTLDLLRRIMPRSLLTLREPQDTLVSVLELHLMTDACSEKTRLLMAYSAAVGHCARLMIGLSAKAKVGTAEYQQCERGLRWRV